MNSHILVLGEPGIGKSQLLKSVQQVVNSLYISGPSVSSVGLTVSINKDHNHQTSIQAGALLQCNNSILLIDEFDKIPTQI